MTGLEDQRKEISGLPGQNGGPQSSKNERVAIWKAVNLDRFNHTEKRPAINEYSAKVGEDHMTDQISDLETLIRANPRQRLDVLEYFLQKHFNFNFAEEASELERKNQLMAEEQARLKKETEQAARELEKATFNQHLKDLGVSFTGPGVKSFDGDMITLVCLGCGNEFTVTANGLGFTQFLTVDTEDLLNIVKSAGANQINIMCPNPRCHRAITIVAERQIGGAPKP